MRGEPQPQELMETINQEWQEGNGEKEWECPFPSQYTKQQAYVNSNTNTTQYETQDQYTCTGQVDLIML